jgi:hypothetical protein
MIVAPLVAEVLPGATRFRAIAVLPIEIAVWGGGALLIREAVRRWRLGWRNMLLLALALAVAEECLIQQTSLAPMVIQVRGQVYARALGVNYLNLLWALVYESVFVVFVPIALTELVFHRRRVDPWLGRAGLVVVMAAFALGALLAWFTWTQIARPKVFHVAAYTPSAGATVASLAVVAALIAAAIGPFRRRLARPTAPLRPPSPLWVTAAACAWALAWYCLVLLAFGVAPQFPAAIAVGVGVVLAIALLVLLPRWAADSTWSDTHVVAAVSGAIIGSMLLSFVAFIGSDRADLSFKIIVDAIALVLLSLLARQVWRRDAAVARS